MKVNLQFSLIPIAGARGGKEACIRSKIELACLSSQKLGNCAALQMTESHHSSPTKAFWEMSDMDLFLSSIKMRP